MKESKKPAHVLGNISRCPKFIQCPLCYGCRAYSSSDLDCKKCEENRKRDICNISLHTDSVVSRFISKNVTKLEGEVKFESNNGRRS